MKRIIILLVAIGLILVSCSKDSTKNRVYSSSWDNTPIVVEQKNDDGNYNKINEITDATQVERLIKALKGANWEENIDVDIEPPDYRFVWNSFHHNVWVIEATGRLQLTIDERSNFVTLSKSSSKIVFEILTDKEFKDHK